MKVLRIVMGSPKAGRLPYVQFRGVRYRSELLNKSPNLIGSRLVLDIVPDDIRTVKAYDEAGIFFDTLSG